MGDPLRAGCTRVFACQKGQVNLKKINKTKTPAVPRLPNKQHHHMSYTAKVVDPTGLKPAPHGLKGRRSVTRAPGQEIGCGGRIRTFDSRINNPVPYQLGYATKTKSGCGDETRTRIISFTRRALCYPIELRRNLVDWEGFKPSQEVCRTSMLSVTSPARNIWWLWVELNHQPRAYETLALFRLSYTAVD